MHKTAGKEQVQLPGHTWRNIVLDWPVLLWSASSVPSVFIKEPPKYYLLSGGWNDHLFCNWKMFMLDFCIGGRCIMQWLHDVLPQTDGWAARLIQVFKHKWTGVCCGHGHSHYGTWDCIECHSSAGMRNLLVLWYYNKCLIYYIWRSDWSKFLQFHTGNWHFLQETCVSSDMEKKICSGVIAFLSWMSGTID